MTKPLSILHASYQIEKILLSIGLTAKGYSKINPRSIFKKNSPKNTLFLNWQDLTKDVVNIDSYLSQSFDELGSKEEFLKSIIINRDCNDISKKKVGEVFEKVFDYKLNLDPTKYIGNSVVKSNNNGTHDGKIISLPISHKLIEENKVYTFLVNNIDNKNYAIDYRIPFYGEIANFCYLKKSLKANRFELTNNLVHIVQTKKIFSTQELSKIDNFCKLMNLDIGEIDCIRDNNSKKIYLIDVNKTPTGPTVELSIKDKIYATSELCNLFIKNFCSKII